MRDFKDAPPPVRYVTHGTRDRNDHWTVALSAYWWEPGDATRYNFVLIEGPSDYDYLTLIIGEKHWNLTIYKEWRDSNLDLKEELGYSRSPLIQHSLRPYERFIVAEFLERVCAEKVTDATSPQGR